MVLYQESLVTEALFKDLQGIVVPSVRGWQSRNRSCRLSRQSGFQVVALVALRLLWILVDDLFKLFPE